MCDVWCMMYDVWCSMYVVCMLYVSIYIYIHIYDHMAILGKRSAPIMLRASLRGDREPSRRRALSSRLPWSRNWLDLKGGLTMSDICWGFPLADCEHCEILWTWRLSGLRWGFWTLATEAVRLFWGTCCLMSTSGIREGFVKTRFRISFCNSRTCNIPSCTCWKPNKKWIWFAHGCTVWAKILPAWRFFWVYITVALRRVKQYWQIHLGMPSGFLPFDMRVLNPYLLPALYESSLDLLLLVP